MRSITVRLLLAFLAISMLSVMLIVLSTRWLTEREFRSYLFTQNRNNIITALADYYGSNGGWAGVDVSMLAPENPVPARLAPGAGRFFSLVDGTDHVVLAGLGDNVGDLLPQSVIQQGSPIKYNGKVVGILITRQPTVNVNPAETDFLNRVRQVYIFSAIGVVSAGQLKQEVPVRSRD